MQLHRAPYPLLVADEYSFLHSCGAILAKLVPARGRRLAWCYASEVLP